MLYYFGGKFNPWTRGHRNILEELCIKIQRDNSWGEKDVIVVGVVKLVKGESGVMDDELWSSYDYRLNLIRPTFPSLEDKYPFLKKHPCLFTVVQDNPSTYEFLEKYCEQRGIDDVKQNVTLVLGQDEEYDLITSTSASLPKGARPKWKYADELINFRRFVCERNDGISSTKVREIFHRNPYTTYDEVKQYITKYVFNEIKRWHHYWQFGYEDEYRRWENKAMKEYDITKFPRPSATVDMIVINHPSADTPSGETKTREGDKILLIRRKNFPYKGFWALPGGFFDVKNDESLEDTATRELMEETDIRYVFGRGDQFRVYSDMGVDPRGRIIDTVFVMENRGLCARANDDACEVGWFDLKDIPRLAFNHRQIIEDYICYRDAKAAALAPFEPIDTEEFSRLFKDVEEY